MLREGVPSRAVLALTATATRATEAAIARALGAKPGCTFRDASLRPNLRLRVQHVNGGRLLLLSWAPFALSYDCLALLSSLSCSLFLLPILLTGRLGVTHGHCMC